MHIISLSFDDGFERSNLRIAEIYETLGLSACFNVLAFEEVDGEKVFDPYHNWRRVILDCGTPCRGAGMRSCRMG
jgi:hypothetical protein